MNRFGVLGGRRVDNSFGSRVLGTAQFFGIIHCTSDYELGAFSQYNTDCPGKIELLL